MDPNKSGNNQKSKSMRLLNAGCGGQRNQSEHWWNTDTLREQLKPGTPERINLDKEPRYVECNLLTQSLPFPDDSFDGVLLQHVLEHFTCHEAVDVLLNCKRVLKPGGLLVASVPDAKYFLSMYDQDTKERAFELFGEPIHDAGHEKFFTYALFRHDHKQILTSESLDCLLLMAGFKKSFLHYSKHKATSEITKQLTRRQFSVEICAIK